MTPAERRLFERMDGMILDASGPDLRKIQEADRQTQLTGVPFYDACANSAVPARQGVRKGRGTGS